MNTRQNFTKNSRQNAITCQIECPECMPDRMPSFTPDKMSEYMLDGMSDYMPLYARIYASRRRNICQIDCLNVCQIECQRVCQIKWQHVCQNVCQNVCQPKCLLDRMPRYMCKIDTFFDGRTNVRISCLLPNRLSGWESLEVKQFSYHGWPGWLRRRVAD